MTNDWDLLKRFARDQAQAAFTELVNRHVNLVYSAALRQVRSRHLAEEITQSVFTDLARNANKLSSATGKAPVLTAWLYQVARRTAIDVIRKESRRQLREQIALEMNVMNAPAQEWIHIEPLLDDAMAALEETDRTAILLRFFENKNLREIGENLNISDDAAQKRIARAVERLREFFSKRNVTIGASGLGALISVNAVQSAPVGLATAISAAAILTGAAISTGTVITATKAIALTALQKALIATTFAAAIGTGIFEAQQAAGFRHQIQTLQQHGPSAEQLQRLQREQAEATNRLATLARENEQLRSGSNRLELLRLRGEVSQLREIETLKEHDSTVATAKSWLSRVSQLKEYLDRHPEKTIPELQYLTGGGWLSAVDPSGGDMEIRDDYRNAIDLLKIDAENQFGALIQIALRKYADANQGQFPGDLSQLQPYCDAKVEDLLRQLYEIKPASILPADRVKELKITTRWVVMRKQRIIPNSSYMAYFVDGNVSWLSPQDDPWAKTK